MLNLGSEPNQNHLGLKGKSSCVSWFCRRRIGPEIAAATSDVRVWVRTFPARCRAEQHAVGMPACASSAPRFARASANRALADGLILGPTATFDFKDENAGEINPSRYFRKISTCLPICGPPEPIRAAQPVRRLRPGGVRKTPKGFMPTQMEQGNGELLVTPMSWSRSAASPGPAASGSPRPPAGCDAAAPASHHRAQSQCAEDRRRPVPGHLPQDRARYPDLAVDDILVDAMMAHVVRQPDASTSSSPPTCRRHSVGPDRGAVGQPRPRRLAQCRAGYAMARRRTARRPTSPPRPCNPISLILSQPCCWPGTASGRVPQDTSRQRARSRTPSRLRCATAAPPRTSAATSAPPRPAGPSSNPSVGQYRGSAPVR